MSSKMLSEKKNQHYIPKFYLRNFSFQGNKKQIGIYNIDNRLFIANGKLKTQGSKNFYYGSDGVIENKLANIEGSLATITSKIISSKTLPERYTNEHFDLLHFVTLTDLRNPVRIEGAKAMFDEINKRVLDEHPNADAKNLMPKLTHEEYVKMQLTYAIDMTLIMHDLDFKLLANESSVPFITSDFPVAKYNQYLEQKKWPHSRSGYGVTGLQIFIPLNREITLMFYDPNIYKVGDKKKKICPLKKDSDVNQINTLQFLNCIDTLFFDETANELYLRKTHENAQKYLKANKIKSEMNYLFGDDKIENEALMKANFRNLIIVNHTDCETNLEIEGIKIHSKGHQFKLNDTMSQMRPQVYESKKILESWNKR